MIVKLIKFKNLTTNKQILTKMKKNTLFHTKDKNNDILTLHDSVVVPEPQDDKLDLHLFSFVGTIIMIFDNGNVTIEDKDGNSFEIEANRLEYYSE